MEKTNFLQSLITGSSYKETENGAFALSSTGNDLLNAFGTLGAMRNRNSEDIINTFMKAYGQDRLLAMKLLFYIRDSRGGTGERDTFRVIANYLAQTHAEDMEVNLKYVPEFGRWDDLYAFVGTKLEDMAFAIMKEKYHADLLLAKEGKPVSLLGKWLKSANASSKTTRTLGELTAKHFGEKLSVYRKNLTMLRKAIDVTEVKMSSQDWDKINYENVPSYAAKNYRGAFTRHDEARYNDFIKAVNSGEATIKAATLFPYDLVRAYGYDCDGWGKTTKTAVNETIEAQWKALPNYVTDSKRFLVMADTSGSMTGTPVETSVSLAMYFAERNTGEFHGKFITFTDNPRLVDIPDDWNLRDKINHVLQKAYVGYGTDLEKAFELVLKSAVAAKLPQSDLPEAILVITDMEINRFIGYKDATTFTSEMKKRFADKGYTMPTLVWWNVNARQDTFHAEASDDVRFISGSSAAIFKGLCEHLGYSAKELMLNVLNDERYSCITVA